MIKTNVSKNFKTTFVLRIFFVTVILFSLFGCRIFKNGDIREIKVFLGEEQKTALTVQEGQIVIIRADVGINPDFVSIAWEIEDSTVAEITSSGTGAESAIRGRRNGETVITIRAWRTHKDVVKLVFPIIVTEAVVTGINLTGLPRIGVGEKRIISAEVIPTWASQKLEWKTSDPDTVKLEETLGVMLTEGIRAGTARLTAETECGFYAYFDFEVRTPDPITGIEIYMDGNRITGGTIELALLEERNLTALIRPANAYTFFQWFSSDSAAVTVENNGLIRSRTANSSAVITVMASGMVASVTVKTGNPVTGIRIAYDNTESLQVLNTIWLYPDDFVNLKIELFPPDVHAEIFWTMDSTGVRLSDTSGAKSILTGVTASSFDSPPVMIRVSARNDDNGTGMVTAFAQVKVLENAPLWAWDRARDSNLNSELLNRPTHSVFNPPSGTLLPSQYPTLTQGNPDWHITGRGNYAETMNQVVFGNHISYAPSGIILNSSNDSGGSNPFHAPAPANSTRIMIGSSAGGSGNASTNDWAPPGLFDFYVIDNPIRISIDYEILWTAGAGRNMWLMINGNNANTNSPLRTLSQALVRPLTDPRGTRATASVEINIPEWIHNRVDGWESLKASFIGIVVLSNGGSVSVSGIRIEEAPLAGDGDDGE